MYFVQVCMYNTFRSGVGVGGSGGERGFLLMWILSLTYLMIDGSF